MLQNRTHPPQRWTLAEALAGELVDRTLRKKPQDRVNSVAASSRTLPKPLSELSATSKSIDFNLPKQCTFVKSHTCAFHRTILFHVRRTAKSATNSLGNGHFKIFKSFLKVCWVSGAQRRDRYQFASGARSAGNIPIVWTRPHVGKICGQNWNP